MFLKYIDRKETWTISLMSLSLYPWNTSLIRSTQEELTLQSGDEFWRRKLLFPILFWRTHETESTFLHPKVLLNFRQKAIYKQYISGHSTTAGKRDFWYRSKFKAAVIWSFLFKLSWIHKCKTQVQKHANIDVWRVSVFQTIYFNILLTFSNISFNLQLFFFIPI